MEESNHLHILNISAFLVTNGENRQTPDQLLCKQKLHNMHHMQLDVVRQFNAHLHREKKITFSVYLPKQVISFWGNSNF